MVAPTICKSIVLPKALNGSENWDNLNDTELLSLELAHVGFVLSKCNPSIYV